ncbi:hypothetical protein DFS33DRAFT_1387448 [Desarmillaria ectypa]|nr:hypothetical protein DFS33DRAFT_1387448 [Desarmillaria ectypa]
MAAFWSDARNVTLHLDTDEVSSSVKDLLRQLEEPLPDWVRKGPFPNHSGHLEYLIDELAKPDADRSSQFIPPPRNNKRDNYLDIYFSFMLNTADYLQTSIRRETLELIHPHALFFISYILGKIWRDSIVVENIRMVVPKHPMHGFNPLMKYTSKTMIAPCLLLHRAVREDSSDSGENYEPDDNVDSNSDVSEYSVSVLSPVSEVSRGTRRHSSRQHKLDNNDSKVSEIPVSDRWTASEFCQGYRNRDAESESEEWCSQGSGDKSSTVPLDEDVIVKPDPDICKADPYLIHGSILPDTTHGSGMLASTLYQRHVWKIKQPTMGIIIAPAQPEIQLVIAWLDKPDVWNDLPPVHAVRIATLNHPSGVFDLQNPFDSLSFVLALFRLHSYIHGLQSTYDAKVITCQHGSREVHALEWRSDHASNAIPECRLFTNLFDKVNTWLKVVNHGRQPESKLDSSNSLSPERLQSVVDRHLGPSLRDSQEEGPFTFITLTSSEGPPGDALYASDEEADGDDDLSNVRSKRYTASAFATAHHRTGSTGGCIGGPSDRTYILLTSANKIRLHGSLFTGAQFSDPAVQTELDVLQTSLVSGQMRFQSSDTLPDPICTHLKNKLELILTASQRARDMKASAQRENIPEVEARSTWDVLLGIANDIPHNGDIHFRLERMIKLPRNDEYGASPEVVQNLRDMRLAWMTDSRALAQRALNIGGEEGQRLSAIALASVQPKEAKCDSLVTLTRLIFPTATMTTTQRSRLRMLSLVTQPTREKKATVSRTPISSSRQDDYLHAFNTNDIIVTSQQQVSVDCSATETSLPASSTLPEGPLQALHNSNDVPMAQDNDSGMTASVSSAKEPSIAGALLFVLCINENKKFLESAGKNGVNQSRMDLVACLKFLAAVGITNFPVYSVITDGTLGTIVSAHVKDLCEGSIYEHNVRTFDISNPVDALNVATFITFISTEHA